VFVGAREVRMRRWWLVALALVPAWPDRAEAVSTTFAWPWGDRSKPMCVGVEVEPVWGDHGAYTGRCRYGAPLGTMQAAIAVMDRRRAVGTARENGLPDAFAARLGTELANIDGLPMLAARKRIKRDAKEGRRSWTSRAAVNCALGGAVVGGGSALYDLIVEHRLDAEDSAKTTALACAGAVLTPALNKWIKSKGFDLED
jgi:hypothetical protein